MPFGNSSWTLSGQGLAPLHDSQRGCYGIFDAQGRAIYVGKSGDIKQRSLSHLARQNPEDACIFRHGPVTWRGALAGTDAEMSALEKRLIVEYQPICNQKVG